MNDFESEIVELRKQYDRLQANHEKTLFENTETIRNLKVFKMYVWNSSLSILL